MSEPIYHEQIDATIAEPLIGTENLKKDAQYFLITSVDRTVVMRKTTDGDEVEFALKEPEFTGYDDGFDYAKFEAIVDQPQKNYMGLYILIMLGLAFIGGIISIAYLLINF